MCKFHHGQTRMGQNKKSILRPYLRSMSTQAYFNMNKKIVTILCIKSSLIWTYDNEPSLRNAILIEHMLFMFSCQLYTPVE